MTDSPAPLSDEDLSADLDGETGPDVRARIEQDPAALGRRVALAEAAARLAVDLPPALDDDQIDRLVTTAMDSAHPSRHHRAGPPAWLVAAVVVVLVAVGLTLVWSGRGDESTDLATAGDGASESVAATTLGTAPDDGAERAEEDTMAGVDDTGAPSAETTAAAPVFLGSFPDADALRSAFATDLVPPADSGAPPTANETPDQAALDRCAQQLVVTLSLDGEPLRSGYALVDDDVVLVYEWAHESFVDASPTTLVTAVGANACDEVALFER